MAEHNNAGLHKKVSSIFDGVPVPTNGGAKQASDAPSPQQNNGGVGKPDAAQPQVQTKPKPQRPVQAPPEPAAGSQAEDDAAVAKKQVQLQGNWERMKSKLLAPQQGVDATRQKTMVIFVPILFVILIFVFIKVFNVSSPGQTNAGSLEPTGTVVDSGGEIDWQIPEVYPATLRDPMQFGAATAAREGTGELVVKGILYSSDNPSAVIADKVVHEGDEVLGVVVVKINKNSVEFEMNGKKWIQDVQH